MGNAELLPADRLGVDGPMIPVGQGAGWHWKCLCRRLSPSEKTPKAPKGNNWTAIRRCVLYDNIPAVLTDLLLLLPILQFFIDSPNNVPRTTESTWQAKVEHIKVLCCNGANRAVVHFELTPSWSRTDRLNRGRDGIQRSLLELWGPSSALSAADLPISSGGLQRICLRSSLQLGHWGTSWTAKRANQRFLQQWQLAEWTASHRPARERGSYQRYAITRARQRWSRFSQYQNRFRCASWWASESRG